MRSWMSLWVESDSNIWSYLPLDMEKSFDFVYTLASTNNNVYTLASTNNNQSAQNLVTMDMSIKSQISLIIGQVIPDQ